MGALTRGRVSAEVHVLRHNGRLLRESTFILSQFPPRVKTPHAFLANRQIEGGFRRRFGTSVQTGIERRGRAYDGVSHFV